MSSDGALFDLRKDKAMTLLDFLSKLSTNDVSVTVADTSDKVIITFFSQGYEGIESELAARPVASWSLIGTSKVAVKVGTVEEP